MTAIPANAVRTKLEGSGVEVADSEVAVKYSTVFKKNPELLAGQTRYRRQELKGVIDLSANPKVTGVDHVVVRVLVSTTHTETSISARVMIEN